MPDFLATLYQLGSPDIHLLRQFGLKPPASFDHGVDTVLGVMNVEGVEYGAKIEVSVCLMPEAFWHFKIKLSRGPDPDRELKISTGSGALIRYWPLIKDIVDGMVVIETA